MIAKCGYMRYSRGMNKWWVLIFGLLTGFVPGAQGGDEVNAVPKRVFVIPIRQEIDAPLVYIVRRGVKEAMEAKADLVVFDMDTNGGRVDKTEEIMDIIDHFPGRTVTYVNKKAFSAGSFISVSTQKIYMAPESVIGAAAPIMLSPGGEGVQDLPSTVEVKMTSAVRALVRREAEKNGYNVDVVEGMVDKNKEVIIDGKIINPKGDILTLTDSEAAKEYGNPPKPLLSSGTVPTLDELLDKLGYGKAERTNIEPTGAETLGAWLNTLSPFLLGIGLLGIYIEIKSPGLILPAVIGGLAFLLYFLGGYVANFSGMEWVLVFILGMALVLSELFLHPGTILPGLLGSLIMIAALIMAMVDHYPGTPELPSLPAIRLPMENLALATLILVAGATLLARLLPKTTMYRNLVSQSASGVQSVNEQLERQAADVGRTGVAISNLRPGGKAQFGEDVLDVITQGEMIEKGQSVRIIGHSGPEAVVELAA